MSSNATPELGAFDDALADAMERARKVVPQAEFAERVRMLVRDSGELLSIEVAALVALDELGLAPTAEIVAPVYARVLAPEDLEPGLDGVVVEGELRELEPTRSFARSDGSRGFVTVARILGSKGLYEVTMWDEHIQPVVGLAQGTRLRFEGLYTKERGGTVELHTGRDARVSVLDDATV